MSAHRPEILATRHAVSAGHYLAAQAAQAILDGGGNAIDAGVAGGITLGVVQSDLVNFAGVAPTIIWHAQTQKMVCLDGLGVWPAAARIEHFIESYGGQIPEGPLRTVVPAAPSSWLTALSRFGTMTFAEVSATAIDLAANGFAVDRWMAEFIAGNAQSYERWPQNAAIYLPDGKPPVEGQRLVQADLAATLTYMADEERAHSHQGREGGIEAAHAAFYKGDIAERIADFYSEVGGWLSREDLAIFRAREEPTVSTRFAGLDVHCCGPWSQGPALAQTLALLEPMPHRQRGHNSAPYLHAITETLKLAFADRERYVGDARFMDVPLDEMLAEDYLAARRALIDENRAWPEMPPAGDPWRGLGQCDDTGVVHETGSGDPAEMSARDTSYVCVADRWGNAFSATPSDISCSTPIVPGTGICPSARGSQGRAVVGHPAAVMPGKRPRLTPNPAMAMENGKPRLLFGTPGGDVQIQAMAQFLLNWRQFDMPLQAAIEAPRLASYSFPSSFAPNTYRPGVLALESRIDEAVADELAAKGHIVERWPAFTRLAGAICAVEIDNGLIRAGADPRRAAYALGR
jgi:gamma-glutamyltranspeptidase/glutathione hydrolase